MESSTQPDLVESAESIPVPVAKASSADYLSDRGDAYAKAELERRIERIDRMIEKARAKA